MRNRLTKPLPCIALLLSISTVSLNAQGTSGSDATIEPRYLIDVPTAGIIAHGNVALDFEFFQANGMLAGVSIGVFDRLVLGLSYGASNIIGTDRPIWNSAPGFRAKVRIIDENFVVPAIAIGFSSQGKETYIDQLSRYAIKSPGFYAVASKNYSAMGYLSLHGGINYSLERSDNDDDINVFLGADKTLGPFLSVLGEYDLGINDSNRDALGRGRGYLNFGLRASVGNGLMIGIVLKDVLKNQQDISIGNRVIQLEYVR